MESNKELELKGISISKVRYGSKSYGLNGKLLIRFVLPNSISSNYKLDNDELPNELPPTKLKIGDYVGIRDSRLSKPIATASNKYEFYGSVYKIERSEITISCDESVIFPPIEHEFIIFSIDKLDQDNNSSQQSKSPLKVLESNLFNNRLLEDSTPTSNLITPVSKQLDQNQLDTVKSILSNQNQISIINGHSGNGKTTTMIELVLQLITNGKKVLICGESQIIVDNILDKILQFKKQLQSSSVIINPTIIGQPSIVYSSKLSNYTLDNKIICNSNYFPVIKEIRDEIENLRDLFIFKSQVEKDEINNKVKQLLDNLVNIEQSFINSVIDGSNITLSTISNLALPLFKDQKFDWVIIIDSGKDSISCIPTHKLSTFNNQLECSNRNIQTLTTQYRHINNKINQLSNYLIDTNVSNENDYQDDLSTLTMIDTCGCDMEEFQEYSNDQCISNEGEVKIIESQVEKLIQSGINQNDIGIISFFNSQIKSLKLKLSSKYPDIEIGTSDQFEGREKDIIIISTVRSNSSPYKCSESLEYISKSTQSSIKSSRKQIIIIGNSDTLSFNNHFALLIQFIKDNGLYKSVLEV